jgi:hypothetical protein
MALEFIILDWPLICGVVWFRPISRPLPSTSEFSGPGFIVSQKRPKNREKPFLARGTSDGPGEPFSRPIFLWPPNWRFEAHWRGNCFVDGPLTVLQSRETASRRIVCTQRGVGAKPSAASLRRVQRTILPKKAYAHQFHQHPDTQVGNSPAQAPPELEVAAVGLAACLGQSAESDRAFFGSFHSPGDWIWL